MPAVGSGRSAQRSPSSSRGCEEEQLLLDDVGDLADPPLEHGRLLEHRRLDRVGSRSAPPAPPRSAPGAGSPPAPAAAGRACPSALGTSACSRVYRRDKSGDCDDRPDERPAGRAGGPRASPPSRPHARSSAGRGRASARTSISRIERGRSMAYRPDAAPVFAVFDAEIVRTSAGAAASGPARRPCARRARRARVARLGGDGWEVVPEVSYSTFGERGSIDLLAWHQATRTLLVIEIKTELTSIEETMRRHDRRSRLAATVVATSAMAGTRSRLRGCSYYLATMSRRAYAHGQVGRGSVRHAPDRRCVPDGPRGRAWLAAPARSPGRP